MTTIKLFGKAVALEALAPILPLFIGVIRYRKLDFLYRYYVWESALFLMITFFYMFDYYPANNLYINYLCDYLLAIFVLFAWKKPDQRQHLIKLIFYFSLCYVLAAEIDLYLFGSKTYRESITKILSEIAILISFFNIFFERISLQQNRITKIMDIVVLSVRLIHQSLWLLFTIIALFVFNIRKMELMDDIELITYLTGVLYAIILAIIILWIPKKEQFLKSS